MPDPEERLRAVLNEAVPEPARQIDAADVRRRAARQRRTTTAIAATVAAALALAVLLPTVLLRGKKDGAAQVISTPTATAPPAMSTTVSVTPSQGLRDGQLVQVTASGFPPDSKVWLSECSDVNAVNPLGCGEQLAAQPFIGTDDHGNAHGTFRVSSRAPAQPLTSDPSIDCTTSCVLVATAGVPADGPRIYKMHSLSFGPSVPATGPNGLVLAITSDNKLALAEPSTGRADRYLTLAGVPGGPSLVATDPAGGWVVTYTPDARPTYGQASERLAVVDHDGATHPFGATHPWQQPLSSLAVSPDGKRVAIALMAATASGSAKIEVMPMPGHPGSSRTWTTPADINEVKSLTWSPDGTRLAYISGTQTGAGIAGDPVVLDVTQPGTVAPTTSTWRPSSAHCSIDAVGWLHTGDMAVIRECAGSSATYSVVDPQTGALRAADKDETLPGGPGCLDAAVHPSLTDTEAIAKWCEAAYVVGPGRPSTALPSGITDAAWPG